MDLTNTYRAFHLKAAKYTFFFRGTWNILKTGHMLGHKSSLSKFKKTESYQVSFLNTKLSDQKPIIGEKNCKKNTNTQKLNNTLLNNQWIIEEITKEILKIPRDK